jgi:hypothetical protein
MPYRRATAVGDTPDWKLSAAIACFCSSGHRRRGAPRVINSMRELPPLYAGSSTDASLSEIARAGLCVIGLTTLHCGTPHQGSFGSA